MRALCLRSTVPCARRKPTRHCAAQDGAAASGASLATEKFAAALKVKQAAQAGRFADVEAELRRLDDRFTDNHPKVLHFTCL